MADAVTQPFWDAVGRHELLLQQCEECGRYVFYPRAHCPYDWSDRLRWEPASGLGTVYAVTVVHRALGRFADSAPYAVVLVDLDEGVRMMSRVLDLPSDQVRIGQRVQVAFVDAADADPAVLPWFRPVGPAA